jgi:diguanylate cyclase (GGDEF)-like protein/PAS domain S-box-containing protein
VALDDEQALDPTPLLSRQSRDRGESVTGLPMLNSGVSILIPAYWVAAGIMLHSGLQVAARGFLGQRDRMRYAFSLSCLCAAGYQVATAAYYQAESLLAAAGALRWQGLFITLFFPAFFLGLAEYTGQRRAREWFALVAALFGALMAYNALSPYSLRFESLDYAPPLRLPWGETLARFAGTMGMANMVARAAVSGVLLWSLWRAWTLHRSGARKTAWLLGACVGLIMAAGAWGALIDLGMIDSIYMGGFAFLGFAALKNAGMAIEFRDYTESLKTANSRLQEEIARRERTEQIIRQLRDGVSVQTGEAFFRRLVESLATQFDADYAFVGLFKGAAQDRIATLAVWGKGAFLDNLSYPLAHAPCAEVVGERTRVNLQGVPERFPEAALVREWGVQSCVGTPFFDPQGRSLGVVVVASARPLQNVEMVADTLEIFAARAAVEVRRLRAETERAEAESALRHSHTLLQALTETQRGFLLEGDVQATFEHFLAPLLDLTGSQYGFIGEVLHDDGGQPYLKTRVYSKVPWTSESRQLYEDAQANGLEFHNLSSLIGSVLASGEAVVANDAPGDPRRAGLPPGHPAIACFLGLPIRQGEAMIGMVGIANRPGGYDAGVAAYLEPFLGACAGLITAYRAAQARRALEVQLSESEERFRTLADSLPVMVWLADLDGRCTWFNRAWLDFTGRSLSGEIERAWVESIHPDDRAACLRAYSGALEAQISVVQEYRMLRRDGEYRSVLDTMAPRHLPDGRVVGYVGASLDLTERRALEAQVRHIAFHDALTGLPNRALLFDRLAQALNQAHRGGHQVALLFVDIDRFKVINDTLGHPTGDALLCEAGSRLGLVLREGDTVARIGGDEFLILLPRIFAARDVAQVATKLISALSGLPFSVLGNTLHATASIGISLYPQDGNDADTLIKHADIALYEAKNRGRNNYQMFDPRMNAMAHQRLLIENFLRRALIRGEFVVYYQPRVSLATGVPTGMEALIRWRHPERGVITPGDFIPVAEEIGMIGEIGDWVLRTACRQARAWQADGLPPLRLAVNVSPRQLREKDFRHRVEQALLDTGLPAAFLDLELTESSIMADPEGAIETLSQIRRLGVHIAVDDFGTGYSSLAYLKRLPVDCLKIDRAFVSGIPDDAEDVVIAQTILAMAKSLKLSVVAEGVETPAQRDFLRGEGCDEGQGYLFSKPLPPEELAEFIRWPIQAPPAAAA